MQSHHIAALILAVPCLAQQSAVSKPPSHDQEMVIPSNVTEVIAPTTVRWRNRDIIRGLQLQDFELYDNKKLQEITADLSDEPISLVVAVQTSSYQGDTLRKVQKIGSLLSDLITGQDGEVAVVGFDHDVQLMQDFTNEGAKVSLAIKNMRLGSANHAITDVVIDATRMLQKRPQTYRRILLLISERRDRGSTIHLREAIENAQIANITIYALDISSFVALASQKAHQPPPALPTTAQHTPAGAALTPTTIDQNYYNGNYVPAFIDLFQGIKNIFVADELDVLTRLTGGKQYSLTTNSNLEKSVQNMSEEVHSQYLLSYVPNNQEEGGFHEIRVVVRRPGAANHTRLGYWLPLKP